MRGGVLCWGGACEATCVHACMHARLYASMAVCQGFAYIGPQALTRVMWCLAGTGEGAEGHCRASAGCEGTSDCTEGEHLRFLPSAEHCNTWRPLLCVVCCVCCVCVLCVVCCVLCVVCCVLCGMPRFPAT